jgi:hypothetical protein
VHSASSVLAPISRSKPDEVAAVSLVLLPEQRNEDYPSDEREPERPTTPQRCATTLRTPLTPVDAPALDSSKSD